MTTSRTLAVLLTLTVAGAAWADGAVTAEIQGQDLIIRGDAGNNHLTFISDQQFQFTIIPANNTTLNGAMQPIVFDVPAGTVDIRLDGGDDFISMAGGVEGNKLRVTFGSGTNDLSANGVRFQDVTIVGGAESDQVVLANSGIDGKLTCDAGEGNDRLDLAGSAVGNKTTVDMGDGDDVVDFDSVNFGKTAKFDLGAGQDEIASSGATFQGALKVTFGDGGSDTALLENLVCLKKAKFTSKADSVALSLLDSDLQKGAKIKTGPANDTVLFGGTSSGGTLSISSGDGNDVVIGGNGGAEFDGALKLNGGGGNDSLTVVNATHAKKAKLLGGNDEDSIQFEGNTLGKGALLNGGRDDDTQVNDFAADNTVNGGKLKVKSFEVTP